MGTIFDVSKKKVADFFWDQCQFYHQFCDTLCHFFTHFWNLIFFVINLRKRFFCKLTTIHNLIPMSRWLVTKNINILVKIVGKNFHQNCWSKFSSKLLVKNRNFCSKFGSKIRIVVKRKKHGQKKLKFWSNF